MPVGVSHLVIHVHLKLQCNISCQKSMSVGGSHLVFHLKLYNTSAKIINLNVGLGCTMRKIRKQGNVLITTIKDTSTILRNRLPELCREGLCMIEL